MATTQLVDRSQQLPTPLRYLLRAFLVLLFLPITLLFVVLALATLLIASPLLILGASVFTSLAVANRFLDKLFRPDPNDPKNTLQTSNNVYKRYGGMALIAVPLFPIVLTVIATVAVIFLNFVFLSILPLTLLGSIAATLETENQLSPWISKKLGAKKANSYQAVPTEDLTEDEEESEKPLEEFAEQETKSSYQHIYNLFARIPNFIRGGKNNGYENVSNIERNSSSDEDKKNNDDQNVSNTESNSSSDQESPKLL